MSLGMLGTYNPQTMYSDKYVMPKQNYNTGNNLAEYKSRGVAKQLDYNNYADIISWQLKQKQMFNYVPRRKEPFRPYQMDVDDIDYLSHKERFKIVPEY